MSPRVQLQRSRRTQSADTAAGREPQGERAGYGRQLSIAAAPLGAVLLVLAAYSNSLGNAFHFDDTHVIVDNLFIRDLGNIPRFFTDASTFSALPVNATYRPIVSTSLAFDYWRAGGLEPAPFHVTQLALLLVTGAMLLFLYTNLFASTGAERWHRWAALFAATLFCVHTANTQTVNYISARSELLAGIGVLGAFLVYIHAPRLRVYRLYLLPMVFGALAKTPAVMFAPLLLAYVLFIEQQLGLPLVFGRRGWPQVRRALISTAPAFAAAVVLYIFVEGMNPPSQDYGGTRRMQYLATQTWIWVRYARLFFLPTGLTADTDLQAFTSWADPRVLAGLALLGGSLLLMWRASLTREHRPIAFGIAWFWIALVPSSTLFPLAEVTNDHRVFFPYMGLTAAVVWWLALRVRSAESSVGLPRLASAVTVVGAMLLLGVLSLATYRRNRVWLSPESLWADVVEKSPNNGRGLMNYGLAQMQQGRFEDARNYFTRALALTPNYPYLHVNLGIATDALGDSANAESWFLRALELDSNFVAGRSLYAQWLLRHGRAREAVSHLRRATALSPADITTRHTLLDLYAAAGDGERLTELARETLELASTDSLARSYLAVRTGRPTGSSMDWFNRGLAHTSANRHASAAAAYRAAVAVDSTNADAWNNLGWSLGKLGLYPEAVVALEHAVRLKPDYALARNNLAWVRGALPLTTFARAFELQTSGRPEDAIPIYRQLLAANPAWVNANYNLGHALMATGRCQEAVAWFMRTLELQPSYALAHLHASTCLERLGRTEEAARHKAAYEAVRASAQPAGSP